MNIKQHVKPSKNDSFIVIFGAVFISAVLAGLKTTGIISWSWWIVALPLWIAPAIWVFAFTALFIVGLIKRFRGK